MASKNEFFERYKDPRWQRRRLEVMEAAGFACEECHATDKTLNVHHGFYGKNDDGTQKMPWDYPDGTLHCVCEDCHEKAERLLAHLRSATGYLRSAQLDEAIGYVHGLILRDDLAPRPAWMTKRQRCVPVGSKVQLAGLANAFGPSDALDWLWVFNECAARGPLTGITVKIEDVYASGREPIWRYVEPSAPVDPPPFVEGLVTVF